MSLYRNGRMPKDYVPHDCTEYNEWCYRCELARDEWLEDDD